MYISHRLSKNDTFHLNGIFRYKKVSFPNNPVQGESVVPEEPVQSAQANLGQTSYAHAINPVFTERGSNAKISADTCTHERHSAS